MAGAPEAQRLVPRKELEDGSRSWRIDDDNNLVDLASSSGGAGESIDLETVGAGDCIDGSRVHLAYLVEVRSSPSPQLRKHIKKGHHHSKSGIKRYAFLRKGSAADYIEEADPPSPPAKIKALPEPKTLPSSPLKHWLRVILVDLSASLASFLITAVIYVSTAQSVVGKLDPRLIFAIVDMALLGTAISGVYLAVRSKVPWAVASLDVGFSPLLTQLGDVCWAGTVTTRHRNSGVDAPWTWTTDGDAMYDHVTPQQLTDFLATYVAASSLTFLAVGIVLLCAGLLKLSRVVEYLPYPVTAGMLASIGVSLIKSAACVAAFGGWRVSRQLGAFWFVLAALSAIALRNLRVLCPPYLAAPVLLAVSIILLNIVAYSLRLSQSELCSSGALFRWDQDMLHSSKMWIPWHLAPPHTLLHAVKWPVVFRCRGVIGAAVVIGVIKIAMKTGSLDTLFPAAEINADDELTRIGFAGNVLPALLLTTGQAYSFSSLKIGQRLQASEKGLGVLTSVCCLATWCFGVGVLKHIPRFVYGALLLDIGWDYVETYFYTPLIRRHEFLSADALTVTAIVAIATATSLLEAIAVGVVLCLLSTASKLAAESVVAETKSGKTTRSTIERTHIQAAILDELGEQIQILTLRGYVFFGSASELLDATRQALQAEVGRFLLLDVTQCFGKFDATAVSAFEQITEMAKHKNYVVLVAPASKAPSCSARIFDTADDALEYAEDALLTTSLAVSPRRPPSSKPYMGLFRSWLEAAGATAIDDLADALESHTADRVYNASEIVYRRGDRNDDAFLFVCAGRFRLFSQDNTCMRKLAPGTAVSVGDYYLSPHARKSLRQHTLVANTSAILLRLAYAALADLERSAPQTALHFHKLMASSLTNKNRNSLLALRQHRLDGAVA